MSVEFSGTIVQNEQYKVKKIAQQLKAAEGTITGLRAEIVSLTQKYEDKIAELQATVKRFMNNGIRIPQGRPKLVKPDKRKVKINE